MKLTVFSHKLCWPSPDSPSGYATDGGFPFQMRAMSELFDSTTFVVTCSNISRRAGEIPLVGHNITVAPVSNPPGEGLWRKICFPFWVLANGVTLLREIFKTDAVYADIPGDVGTIAMLLALLFRRPLYIRHCGNWFVQRTAAERFWKWFMERFAGGRNVMLATGGADEQPSRRNPAIKWIFATSLTEQELDSCSVQEERPRRGSLRLMIACRQEKEKGTGVVLESLPLIIEDFPEVYLDVAGEGDALKEFKEMTGRLGVSDRVTFHGKVDHATVLRLLRQADLFCYPTSASEGFPKVVLEALACGLPVVTTRVSVLPLLIGSGCGLLIEETTPDAIAQAVRTCLTDAKAYRAMSERAKLTARQYSLECWRDTIGGLLRRAWGPLRQDA